MKLSVSHLKMLKVPMSAAMTAALTAAGLAMTLAACTPQTSAPMDPNVNTGSEQTEKQYGVLSTTAGVGFQAFISSERVRVRSTPEVTDSNLVGVLELNDKVEIVDPARLGENQFVAVKVISTNGAVPKDQTVYVSANYLNDSPIKVEGQSADALNTTVIINVASDKVRVYKKCAPGEDCVHRMVVQQDVVNGEDLDGKDGEASRRTDLGVYRVTDWVKFYETMPRYSAWYKPGYPELPGVGDRAGWISKGNKYTTVNGVATEMRGAFGWYTAHVGPNQNGQWFHGTAGHGADQQAFIMFHYTLLGRLAHFFAAIDSHGCTRNDNETIALMRSIVPVGARYLKVYAKEALRDPARKGYSKEMKQFPYILTKNGAQVTNNHELADRDVVLANHTPQDKWLEQGTLTYSAYPNPVSYREGGGPKGGDRYDIGEQNMHGVFLVDEGTFVNYKHPEHRKIGYGGYFDGGRPAGIPAANVSTDTNYTVLKDNGWKKH